jgi:uncharacterized membrane protein (UPF0127 family)
LASSRKAWVALGDTWVRIPPSPPPAFTGFAVFAVGDPHLFMKKFSIFFSIVSTLLLASYFLVRAKQSRAKMCFGESCFLAEIADTARKRQLGLMGRENLAQGGGMLFVFEEEGLYPFWMKNTLIPLDIIWLNAELKVVDVQSAAPCHENPCPVYTPCCSAKYALEINKDIAKEIGISQGLRARVEW